MATHSRILAWKIPWTEEPGRLQSTGHKSRIQLSTLSFLSLLMCDFICLKFSSFKNSVCRPPSLGSLPAVYSLSWATTACHLALGSHSCYTTSYSSACHAVSSLGTGTISFNSLLLVHDKSSWHKVGTCVRAHTLCNPVGFSRQEYWSELLFPSPGDLPNPGIEPTSPVFPALQADSLPLSHQGSSISLVTLSCLTLGKPMDCSSPVFSVRGILQARILEWIVNPFFRGSSRPRDWPWVSRIAGRFFTIWATRSAPQCRYFPNNRRCQSGYHFSFLILCKIKQDFL